MMILTYLLLAVVALQVVDFWTTAHALRAKKAVEGNPIMARIMQKVGTIPALLLTKAAVVALAVYLWNAGSLFWVTALAIAYTVVVANNLRLIVGRGG